METDPVEDSFDNALALLEGIETRAACLDLILLAAPVPIVVGNAETWLVVSFEFASRLGYKPRELEAIPWQTLVSKKTATATEAVLSDLHAQAGHVMTYRARNGDRVTVEWVWSAPDEHGHSVAVGRYL